MFESANNSLYHGEPFTEDFSNDIEIDSNDRYFIKSFIEFTNLQGSIYLFLLNSFSPFNIFEIS